MNYTEILEPAIRSKRLGIFSDFDGTLSNIVDQPETASIAWENRQHLQNLKQQAAAVGIISGRAVKDLVKRVDIKGLEYVGNHGLEHWLDGKEVAAGNVKRHSGDLALAVRDLTPQLLPGMQLEDKRLTLSVHFRQTASPAAVRKKFWQVIKKVAMRRKLKLFHGRGIFELRPPIEIDKGTAFELLIKKWKLTGAIYIGDDVTDTAAFIAARKLRRSGVCAAYSVGVIDQETPQSVVELADTSVEGVAGVTSFLSWLNEKLRASST